MNVFDERLLHLTLLRVEWAILIYFLLVNCFYAIQLVAAARALKVHDLSVRRENRWRILGSDVSPRISILAPAFNEEATIAQSVRSLLTLEYPSLELVVANDGSRDGTLEVLIETFELEPVLPIYRKRLETRPVRGVYRSRVFTNLVVVDKENGGKADALNVALNFATGEFVCAIDADTLIEPDALQRMVRPFLMRSDVVAAGGTIRVANGCRVEHGRVVEVRAPRSALAALQSIEYLRAFLFGRLGWNDLGGNLIISGAFGLFRAEVVHLAGGYEHETVGEDMELVVRIRRTGIERGLPSRIDFVPDPVAWTEVPETLRVLSRQRDRWHRGLAEVLWRHRDLMLNRRYGTMGLVVYPSFVLFELLSPLVELIGVVGLLVGLAIGAVNVPFALLFFLAAYGFGMILSVASLLLEELGYHRYRTLGDRVRLVGWALVENLGYRQLTVFWRLRGLWRFLRGRKEWGAMERRGFASRS